MQAMSALGDRLLDDRRLGQANQQRRPHFPATPDPSTTTTIFSFYPTPPHTHRSPRRHARTHGDLHTPDQQL